MNKQALETTAKAMVAPGKGILAADESSPTIEKRLSSVGVASTAANRRAYRDLLFSTPEIEPFISGVILFDETMRQSTKTDVRFPQYLTHKGILPGIKVDTRHYPVGGLGGVGVFQRGQGGAGAQECLAHGQRFSRHRARRVAGPGIPGSTDRRPGRGRTR